MKTEQFAYWLQGFAELTAGQTPTKEQWELIVEHLAECFDKVTPPLKSPGYIDPNHGMFAGIRTMEFRPSDANPSFGTTAIC